MFENLYGLSCVENQTLAILTERSIDVRPLYRDSAMPMKELFFFLVYHGNKQEYFDRITRVQDLARELGIISLELCDRLAEETVTARRAFSGASPIGNYDLPAVKSPNPARMIEAIRTTGDSEYILTRVTKEFTKNRLHARGLRDDHYVRVWAAGDGFNVLNDIPETVIALTAEEFAAAYGGDFFRLRVKRDLTDADRRRVHKSRVFKTESNDPFYFEIDDFAPVRRFPYEPKEIGLRLRNMAGIYKTLRYRMAEYYGQYADTGFIRERMPEAEKYYAQFEYFNLKKSQPFTEYFEIFRRLNQMDNELMEELKQRLAG